MSNILEGPNPDEMKAGETYNVVQEGVTQAGETRLAFEKVEDVPGYRKLTIEIPENVHQILEDLAIFYGLSFDESLKEIIYQNIDSELDTCGGLGSELAKFLSKKYGYSPRVWREKDQ